MTRRATKKSKVRTPTNLKSPGAFLRRMIRPLPPPDERTVLKHKAHLLTELVATERVEEARVLWRGLDLGERRAMTARNRLGPLLDPDVLAWL